MLGSTIKKTVTEFKIEVLIFTECQMLGQGPEWHLTTGCTIRGLNPGGGKRRFLPIFIKIIHGSQTTSSTMPTDFYRGGKAAGRGVDKSPP
jgi:hypothetical protein